VGAGKCNPSYHFSCDNPRPQQSGRVFPQSAGERLQSSTPKDGANRAKDDIVIVDQHSALTYPNDMTPQKGQFIHPDQGGGLS
jgi:hypothetical protein